MNDDINPMGWERRGATRPAVASPLFRDDYWPIVIVWLLCIFIGAALGLITSWYL